MFEGEWSNLDPAKLAEVPFFFPDLFHDYFDPSLCYMPENSIDLQLFPVKREEDSRDGNAFLFAPPEWQLASEGLFPPTENDLERDPVSAVLQVPVVRVLYQQTKQVGPLSIEERQAKIQRFLAKRLRRNFHKKVVYLCRKRVADTRLRVKGRFVAKQLAASLKGLENHKNNVTLPQDPAVTQG